MTSKRDPLFACVECGKKFYSAKAAEKAAYGDSGCPGCGGSDIDLNTSASEVAHCCTCGNEVSPVDRCRCSF